MNRFNIISRIITISYNNIFIVNFYIVGDVNSLNLILNETNGKVLRKWSRLGPLHKAASVGCNISYFFFQITNKLIIIR